MALQRKNIAIPIRNLVLSGVTVLELRTPHANCLIRDLEGDLETWNPTTISTMGFGGI